MAIVCENFSPINIRIVFFFIDCDLQPNLNRLYRLCRCVALGCSGRITFWSPILARLFVKFVTIYFGRIKFVCLTAAVGRLEVRGQTVDAGIHHLLGSRCGPYNKKADILAKSESALNCYGWQMLSRSPERYSVYAI